MLESIHRERKKMVIYTAVWCYSEETNTRRIATYQGGLDRLGRDRRLVVISRRASEQGDINDTCAYYRDRSEMINDYRR